MPINNLAEAAKGQASISGKQNSPWNKVVLVGIEQPCTGWKEQQLILALCKRRRPL